MLTSATEHYRLQQRIVATAVAEVEKRAKAGGGTAAIVPVVAAYQLAAAQAAARAFPAMLAEQGIQDPAIGAVAATALAGTTSAGFPLDNYFGAIRDIGGLGLAVATQIQDAGRNAEAVAMVARAKVGYARMLNLPSCSRCIVLAGAWYKWNAGFERHPKCDCRHIPATEASARGVTTNPDDAFAALTPEQQDKSFSKAGAEAIRLGADIGQVVRARRGMRKAQLYGREAFITTEGTTKSGIYGRSQGADLGYVAERIGRYGYVKNQTQRRAKRVRIMPETIFAIAENREDAQRLLRLYRYII